MTRMREVLHHRGPDGGETWIAPDGAVGLGFRRLAIVDLDVKAMQPMANEDGSVQLLFNGEIYNHAAIRRELIEGGGHTFRTDHSDTETVVHAFEEWGIDCPSASAPRASRGAATASAAQASVDCFHAENRKGLCRAGEGRGMPCMNWPACRSPRWDRSPVAQHHPIPPNQEPPPHHAATHALQNRETTSTACIAPCRNECPDQDRSVARRIHGDGTALCSWAAHPLNGNLSRRPPSVSPLTPIQKIRLFEINEYFELTTGSRRPTMGAS